MNSEKILSSKSMVLNNPFQVHSVPFIVKLSKVGYYKFRKRWAKRFFKRPFRALFNFAYHTLKMSGEGEMTLTLPSGSKRFSFNGRNLQYSGVYAYGPEFVFEAPLVAVMEKLLEKDEVFFDIGANWGCLSFYAAAFPNYTGAIHAFEPMPGTHTDLQNVVDQTGLSSRITCHKVGLSDRTDSGTMILPDGIQSGWAKIVKGGKGIDVELSRLDDMDLPDPKFLKIDAEGHELELLRGAEKTLQKSKPFIMFENWLTPHELEEMIGPWCFLESLGYTFFCPGWRRETPAGPEVSFDNMPPDGAEQCLIPVLKEHRFMGPTHWSFLAVHEEKINELTKKFDNN
jgi:FkbM family methyltransferase